MSFSNEINLILFSQHGMQDNNKGIGTLAHKIAPSQSHVVAPSLGLVQTHFEIEPLIQKLEQIAEQTLREYLVPPARIMAHSLGGVLWVEVLSKHPEWWKRFESLVLLGSPIGGADLARIVDPFGWGIGMAKHLGQSRRTLAEQITAQIPTLVVAGNTTGGGDGTVPIESTKLKHAHFVCLDGVGHRKLRVNPANKSSVFALPMFIGDKNMVDTDYIFPNSNTSSIGEGENSFCTRKVSLASISYSWYSSKTLYQF
ncbi:MAG: alpha/beta hydrolase [Cyanobacteria bacterium J06626_14]